MPRLRPNAAERRREILGAWQRHYRFTDEEAAKVLGISLATLKRRRKKGDWSVMELHLAIRAFHIPPIEALELLTVGCYPMEQFTEKEKRKKYGTE